MRRLLSTISLLLILSLVPAGSARALTRDAQAEAQQPGLQQLLSPLPVGVRGVLVIHDPVAIRSRLLTSEPALALARLGMLGPFDRPWKSLATAMDRTSSQLVDDLTGGGLALIVSDLPAELGAADPGPRSAWSALSLVSEETARLMRERLRAIPAMLVQGQPVYAIEDGSLWLIIRPLAAPVGGRSHVLVLTSPDGGEARVEPIARLLSAHDDARQREPGPWSLVAGLIDRDGSDAADSPTVRSPDLSLVWQLQQPEPLWVGAVASIQADRWHIAATSAAMAHAPAPLSDPGLVDRLAKGDSQTSLLLHLHGDLKVDGVITPGETLTQVSRSASGKPIVAHAARTASTADAARELDARASSIRGLLAVDSAADAALNAILEQLEPTTWRQVPLNLRSGSPLRAIFGPSPAMAWRTVSLPPRADGTSGAWALWVLDPSEGEPGAAIAGQLGQATADEARPYVARLRLQPRLLRDTLPPLFTLTLNDLGVIRGVDADAWVEQAPGSPAQRLRMRGEIRFGKP